MPTVGLGGLAVLAVIALAGCNGDKHQDTPQPPVNSSATVARPQRPAASADATNAMVEAATLGKANAPLKLKFEITSRPVVGQTIVVNLALLAAAPAQAAKLQFDDSPGLVFADRAEIVVGALQPEEPFRHEVRVTATAEGVYFLGLTATMTQDSIVETRRFSIPIIVSAR